MNKGDSTTILQEIENCKSTESFKSILTEFGLESLLECMAQYEIQNEQLWTLLEEASVELSVEEKLLELNEIKILGYLKYGSWRKIPLLLLKQRQEIFDDAEFLNGFLEILKEYLEDAGLDDIFEHENLDEILAILLSGTNDNMKQFLDTMMRLDHRVIAMNQVEKDIKEKIASNPVFHEATARGIKDNLLYNFRILIDFSQYPDFAKSKAVIESVKQSKEDIIKEVESGFHFSEMGEFFPWDIYWLSQFPSLETEVLNIMDNMIPCVANSCYVEGFTYNDGDGPFKLPPPNVLVEKITRIPFFLQNPDIQLGIAKAIRTDSHHSWIENIRSEDFMNSNPLILVALHSTIIESSIQTLIQQIKESKVPLLVIQEVLVNKQFRKRASVMDEVNKRIPDIVSLIEEVISGPNGCSFHFVSLIMYLVNDENLLEYPDIRKAIEKRLPEFQRATSDWRPDYMTMVNEKLVDKTDPAGQLWEKFPDISSLTFIVDDGLHVIRTDALPNDFPGPDYGGSGYWIDIPSVKYDIPKRISEIVDSGGESTVKILLLILEQLMEQVDHSTYVHAKIAGGYDNYTPASVWYEVRNWVILHLRDKMTKEEIDKIMEQYKYED